MKKYSLLIINIILLFSCDHFEMMKNINSKLNKEIKISNGLRCCVLDNDTNLYNILNKEIKIISYIDSIECESCALSILGHWPSVINSMNMIDVPIIFILNTKKREKIDRFLNNIKFNYPIFYDESGYFKKQNSLGNNKKYHTFLLDHENRIRVIGLPIYNTKRQVLYKENILNMKKQK